MRGYEVKRNMTNTGSQMHRPNYAEDLPVVLLHGTSGPSEDWSQVGEQRRRHRPVIRSNYAEPVIGIDSANGGNIIDNIVQNVISLSCARPRWQNPSSKMLGAK
jgi:hypothetical protein